MWKQLFGVTLVVSCVCMATAAHARRMYPGQWWRLPEVSQQLALTDQQKQQLDTLFNANRSRLMALRDTVRQQRHGLEQIMEQEPLDAQQARALFHKLDAARSALAAERFEYILQVRRIIGAKAFQQLRTFFHRWHHPDKAGQN